MATSGSWNYSLTAANVITVALENIGVLGGGAATDSNDSTLCLRRLNLIAKQYQGRSYGAPGLPIHTRERVTLMFAKGQQSYLIGPASTDARASTQVGRTTIRAAEAAGQTVLDVTALTDTTSYPGTTITMTAADIIGIQTDDSGGDDIYWTTISSTNSTGPTVTIGAALPTGRPAAAGNYVYWFTSRAQRFPHIESAVLRNSSDVDTPLDIYTTVQEYQLGVADKTADGTPTAMLVEPQRIATRLTFNTQPTDMTDRVILTVLYPAEDYDATTDDVAFPQEAMRFLGWELAFEVAPAFGATWTDNMERARQEARAMWFNLNPENSVLHYTRDGDY